MFIPLKMYGTVIVLTYSLHESPIIPNLPELVYEEVKASGDEKAG